MIKTASTKKRRKFSLGRRRFTTIAVALCLVSMAGCRARLQDGAGPQRTPQIGSDAYLQEKFGIVPESDSAWAFRDYSVIHYRDPTEADLDSAPEDIVPWPSTPSSSPTPGYQSWPYGGKHDANRKGLALVSAVFYSYPSRQLAVLSEEMVDPGNANALSDKSRPRLRFLSSARWGWSPDHFFSPTFVLREPETQKEQKVSQGALEAFYLAESEGDRVMADFVWPLLVDGRKHGSLVLRCVIWADEPLCLYARAMLNGDAELEFQQLYLASWAGGTGLPGNQIWISGATRTSPAPPKGTALPLDEYWFYAIYGDKLINGERGAVGVFAPETLTEIKYPGGWAGAVALMPNKQHAKAMVFALEDMGGKPGQHMDDLVAKSRSAAAARRQRLTTMNWRPDWAAQIRMVESELNTLTEMLGAEDGIEKSLVAEINQLKTEVAAVSPGITMGAPAEVAIGLALQRLGKTVCEAWGQAADGMME